MPTSEQLTAWVERYVHAWNSNDPGHIGNLFSDGATYRTEPFRPAWVGRQTIVANWLENKDEPGETTFTWQPLVVTEDVAIVRGETAYRTPPRRYSNLWVIRLDPAGRCTEFTEWWMRHDASSRTRVRGGPGR